MQISNTATVKKKILMQISNTAKFTATVKILIDFLDVIFKFITILTKELKSAVYFIKLIYLKNDAHLSLRKMIKVFICREWLT